MTGVSDGPPLHLGATCLETLQPDRSSRSGRGRNAGMDRAYEPCVVTSDATPNAPYGSGLPPRVVVAIPPGDLLLEVALNLFPLAEAGAITLVLFPNYPRVAVPDAREPLVIRAVPGAAGKRRLLRVSGLQGSSKGEEDVCLTSISWLESVLDLQAGTRRKRKPADTLAEQNASRAIVSA